MTPGTIAQLTTSPVAIAALVVQLLILRANQRYELKKIALQADLASAEKARHERRTQLRDYVTELLTLADGEVDDLPANYTKAVRLIKRIQLLLDLRLDDERKMNAALNKLGLAMRSTVDRALGLADFEDDGHWRNLLSYEGELIDTARRVILWLQGVHDGTTQQLLRAAD